MNFRPALPLALLLAATTGGALALAETPLPDPVAPAVIGRPLEQIRPARPAKATQAKPAGKEAKVARPPAPATAPQAARPGALQQTAAAPAAPAAQPGLLLPGAEPDTPLQRQAKKALDDRFDTRVRTDDVGRGTHFARKALGPGAYFDDKDRAAVRKYFASNPPGGNPPQWQVGQALPAGAALGAVPRPVLASLPKLPPGHRYVQLGGDILLVAVGSQMVVDGISVRAH